MSTPKTKSYPGYLGEPTNNTVGWLTNVPDAGPVRAANFSTDAIACHNDAQPAPLVANVTAGTNVSISWLSTWPDTHHGPMLDYLAACPDNDCTTADKTQLRFFKISEVGLLNQSVPLGYWGSDVMREENNLTWSVQIPASIAPGQYVLRHEVLALHQSDRPNGTEAYPQCINLEVQSSGTDRPEGVLATQLYKNDGPGMDYDIYNIDKMPPYTIPGPAVYTG